ncbi:hypothetical protein T4D_13197 [Trichinella pseudospiralis]|uniref:Uncharacterized protein n=1 Tax=Trichinella pseudospiralis TaxID=6337 RepID=A0A0V1FN49_TRIPS|nr:hypothetical protein T4D_13197 [Trichinella pseudospiralis]
MSELQYSNKIWKTQSSVHRYLTVDDDKCSINSNFHTPINCLHFKKDLMPNCCCCLKHVHLKGSDCSKNIGNTDSSVFEQRNVNVVTQNVKLSHNTGKVLNVVTAIVGNGFQQIYILHVEVLYSLETSFCTFFRAND